MKVNVVAMEWDRGWTPLFRSGVVDGLRDLGVDVTLVSSGKDGGDSALRSAPSCDVWYVLRHIDYAIPTLRRMGQKVVTHIHGGPETGTYACDFAGSMKTLKGVQDVLDAVDAVTVNSQYHANCITRTYTPSAARKVHVVGFPVDVGAIQRMGRKDRGTRVVVPGRITHTKNPLILSDALRKVPGTLLFTSHDPPPKEGTAVAEIVEHLTLRGHEVRFNVNREAHLEVLRTEAFCALFGGTSETLCVSAIEALAVGCPVVVPNVGPYGEYTRRITYRAFDLDHMRECVWRARGAGVYADFSLVDPTRFAGKLLHVLASVAQRS